MGTLKLEHIRAAQPDVLVSGDMSCMMHIGGLAEKEGKPIKTLHVAQILRDALKNGGLLSGAKSPEARARPTLNTQLSTSSTLSSSLSALSS
jgi:hypothetical protein